jgi:GNAT superfamily N-acetyltransferase
MSAATRPSGAIIRTAEQGDAAMLAVLLEQLGYPATADEVVERLARLGQLRTAVVLVGEVKNEVVALATSHVFPSIHATPPAALLTTLVVHAAHRGAGIGAALCRAVEDWARAQGAIRISLTSGLQRAGAHVFYERIGYQRTGVRLGKTLTPASHPT